MIFDSTLTTSHQAHHNMPIDGGATAALSAVSGALATTIKITEKVFEILAVDEQSRSLLATINQVNQQLETAKTLRRQKSSLLSANEKRTINQTFVSTEEALDHVAKLVEKTRVDQQIRGGRVGFHSRMHFILRDSPNIVGPSSITTISIFPADIEWQDGQPHSTRHRKSATQHDGHHIRPSSKPTHQRYLCFQRAVPFGKEATARIRRVSDDCGSP